MNSLRIELKICEGCGVLWLRSGKADGVYCRGCFARLAEFPARKPGRCRNRRRAPVQPAVKRSARCPKLAAAPPEAPVSDPEVASMAPPLRKRCFGGAH